MPSNPDRPLRARDYLGQIQLARRAAGRGELDRALDEIRQARDLDPTRPEAYNVLGAFSELKGRLEDAERWYRTAVDVAPGYEAARHNLERVRRAPEDTDIWLA